MCYSCFSTAANGSSAFVLLNSCTLILTQQFLVLVITGSTGSNCVLPCELTVGRFGTHYLQISVVFWELLILSVFPYWDDVLAIRGLFIAQS